MDDTVPLHHIVEASLQVCYRSHLWCSLVAQMRHDRTQLRMEMQQLLESCRTLRQERIWLMDTSAYLLAQTSHGSLTQPFRKAS